MSKYLQYNNSIWQNTYYAPNVESVIFRLHGRILKSQFKLPKTNKLTTTLDFGCGQGSTVNYLNRNGYDAYGIDISDIDIEVAKNTYPHIAHKFFVCKQGTGSVFCYRVQKANVSFSFGVPYCAPNKIIQ